MSRKHIIPCCCSICCSDATTCFSLFESMAATLVYHRDSATPRNKKTIVTRLVHLLGMVKNPTNHGLANHCHIHSVRNCKWSHWRPPEYHKFTNLNFIVWDILIFLTPITKYHIPGYISCDVLYYIHIWNDIISPWWVAGDYKYYNVLYHPINIFYLILSLVYKQLMTS